MKRQKLIKVYCPVKEDSNIKGYWKDETGKVFIDNIKIWNVTQGNFFKVKRELFSSGKLAIFYIQNDIAYVLSENNLEKLSNKIILENISEENLSDLLNKYNGFTYFKALNRVEIWTK